MHDFIRRKGWRMMREKKSTTPSLTFLALFLNKIDNLVEKADMHFGGIRINQTC